MDNWVDHWKAGGQAGDAHRIVEALTDDAVLISPITDQFVFRGRTEIEQLLVSVFEVFTDITYTDDVRSGDQVALFAHGRVGDITLHEAQHLKLDADGRIRELTLMMRPLPAVTRFLRELGPKVARGQGRAGAARVLTVAGAFLDTVAASGDSQFIPLARPESAR